MFTRDGRTEVRAQGRFKKMSMERVPMTIAGFKSLEEELQRLKAKVATLMTHAATTVH